MPALRNPAKASRKYLRSSRGVSEASHIGYPPGLSIQDSDVNVLPRSAEEFELESLGHFPVYVTAGAVIPMWEAASEKVRTGGWGDSLRLEVFVPSRTTAALCS